MSKRRSASDDAVRWAVSLRWLFALAACVWVVRISVFAPLTEILAFTPDDSLFYFDIAWNFARTHHFVYGRELETYGFQPLWQLLLAGLACVFEGREALLRAGYTVLGVVHCLDGILIGRLLQRQVGALAASAGAGFWLLNPRIVEWTLAGKENGLYLALLVLLLLHVGSAFLRPRAAPPRGVALGGLLGTLVLVRVNSVLIACVLAPILAWVGRTWWQWQWRRLWGIAATTAVTATGVALPWFLYARLRFGSFLPQSGVWKIRGTRIVVEGWGIEWLSAPHFVRLFDVWREYLGFLAGFFAQPVAYAWAVVALLAAARVLGMGVRATLRSAGTAVARDTWVVGGALAACALLNGALDVLLLTPYLMACRWYAVPELLLLTVLLAVGVELVLRPPRADWQLVAMPGAFLLLLARWHPPGLRPPPHVAAAGIVALAAAAAWIAARFLRERREPAALSALSDSRWLRAAGLAALAAISVAGASSRVGRLPPNTEQLYPMALWARDHVPDDLVLAANDSGIITYFSGRRVVSIEGLVSGPDFVREGWKQLDVYLRSRGIRYALAAGSRQADGRYVLPLLPRDSYEVEWVPFPDRDLGWGDATHLMLVRLDPQRNPPLLGPEDFPFGIFRPDG